jgi:hypothetical protein
VLVEVDLLSAIKKPQKRFYLPIVAMVGSSGVTVKGIQKVSVADTK